MAADRRRLTRQNLSSIVGTVRASRLVALLLLLQARGRMTAAALAGELEVSPRTIQRDVEALAAAGVPVYSERGRDGGYRLVGGYRSRLTGLGPDEARALVAVGTAAPARELGLGRALMSARLKLIASLPAGLRDEMSAAASRFHLDAPGWFARQRPVPFLEALAEGVFGDLVVEARYRGRSGPRSCRLEPFGLVLKAGTWYVVARERGEGESGKGGGGVGEGVGGKGGAVRGYRADRFDAAAVTGQRFGRPEGFDLAAFWAAWIEEFERSLPVVMVSVRARADRAGTVLRALRRVVEPGYAGQVDWDVAPDPDGWARLALPFEKLEYARAALLGFGPDVEVLAPGELRAQMAAAAAGLSALYS
jgi:predicted DNA-binding transcriptional regulator YafY